MSNLVTAVQRIVDPSFTFKNIIGVTVARRGRVYSPFVKNAITRRRMFLREAVWLDYEFEMPVGYHSAVPDDIEYVLTVVKLCVTEDQLIMMSLGAQLQ